MSNILSAAPAIHMQGILDDSGNAPVREPLALPTHLAHVYLYAEDGPTLPHLASGAAFSTLYGAKTLDTRSPYYNHASELASQIMGAGNAIMAQRIRPADGKEARLLLSLDIVADDVQQYERNDDKTFKRDETGAKIPVTGSGAKIPGHRARLVLNDWTLGNTVEEFGLVSKKAGGLTSSTDVQSQVIPLIELPARWFGNAGNNKGTRFSVPTTQSGNPINDNLVSQTKSYIYRLQLVKRNDPDSTTNVINTLLGSPTLDFSLKPDAIDTSNDSEIYLARTFKDAYEAADPSSGMSPVYGAFGDVHIYEDNIKEVLAMIGAKEAPAGLLPELTMDANSQYLYMVNLLGATDQYGTPYYSYELLGPAQGGILLSDASAQWAVGGADGTQSFTAFDSAVRNELTNYGQLEAKMENWAKYPVSFYYDSGFTLDTKLAFLRPIGVRKDVISVLSTQDISQPQNDGAKESSMAINLKNAARLYPESEIFGTKVCRAVVVGHSGQLLNSKYRGPQNNQLPLTIEFAAKCAAYMGAGTGIWNSNAAFDESPNNQISKFKNVNITDKGANARLNDWRNGLIWAQDYDMLSQFWPGLQTVYDDDTSILNNFFNVAIAVDLWKVAQRAWADLTGSSGKLTQGQFIAKSNELITSRTEGKYDGRVTIKPDTYFTVADEQRGYSWKTDIHMYGEQMRTVGTYSVVAHDTADLVLAQ